MKATMRADGTLTISGENDLEHFALSAWWDLWQVQKTSLQVAILGEGSPHITEFKSIKPE